MSNIKTWQERYAVTGGNQRKSAAMQAEITDLRAANQKALELLKAYAWGTNTSVVKALIAALEGK